MAVSPANSLSTALDEVRTLIASCAGFQTWTGTASAAAAKAYVYAVATESFTRPGVRIGWLRGKCGRGGYMSGVIECIFEGAVSSAYSTGAEKTDHASAAYEFTNYVGLIMAEMMQNGEGAGYTFATQGGIQWSNGLARTGPEEGVDYCQWRCFLNWGIDPP